MLHRGACPRVVIPTAAKSEVEGPFLVTPRSVENAACDNGLSNASGCRPSSNRVTHHKTSSFVPRSNFPSSTSGTNTTYFHLLQESAQV